MAGIMIHVGVPLYVTTLGAVMIWRALHHEAVFAWPLILLTTYLFLATYGVFTMAVTAGAAMVDLVQRADARRRHDARDAEPASISAMKVETALRNLSNIEGYAGLGGMLKDLRESSWRHAEPSYQQVAADLTIAAETFANASRGADAEEIGELRELVSRSLRILLGRLRELEEANKAASARSARTVTGYLAGKYGESSETILPVSVPDRDK